MPSRPILAFVCVLSISVAISPSYAGDILYCDGFENVDKACQASLPLEPSCVDGIINQGETGFQYKNDAPGEQTGTECGGPNCAPCYDDAFSNIPNPYGACVSEPALAICVDGGAGHPAYHSYACTSDTCICETYNADLANNQGYWFDQGANNYDGTYRPQKCDKWVEYCKENEYADVLTGNCESCPAGTTRRAGDDPLRDRRDATACAIGG